jgi:hypothetical protein
MRHKRLFTLFTLIAIVSISFIFGANVHAAQPDQVGKLEPLFSAMIQVESPKGEMTGDAGKALGRFQIHYEYWADSKTPGNYADCKSTDYSKRVMVNYWRRYASEALRRGDYETLARIHNGGPSGAQKDSTANYWRKVNSHLN